MILSRARAVLTHLLLARSARPPRRRRGLERGMTLVEVMVVVVIISLVAGVVGVTVFGQLTRAQRNVAYTQIKELSNALGLYKLSNRHFPSTGEGLQALTVSKGSEQPVMTSIPKDPWGNDYVYVYPGTNNPASFDIMSYGPDGVQGGGDDVNNWDSLDGAAEGK